MWLTQQPSEARSANQKRAARWRSPGETKSMMESGRLFIFRCCRECERYDFVFDACPYVGKTSPDASCDFWTQHE